MHIHLVKCYLEGNHDAISPTLVTVYKGLSLEEQCVSSKKALIKNEKCRDDTCKSKGTRLKKGKEQDGMMLANVME